MFNQWKAENGKAYASPAAENAAFAIFNAAVTSVIAHNSNPNAKFFKGGSESMTSPGCDALLTCPCRLCQHLRPACMHATQLAPAPLAAVS